MTAHSALSASALDDDNPLTARKPFHDEAHFDITAMIDLVFMMNIFFLVTTVGAALAEIDLPAARHCSPSDHDAAVVFTMTGGGDRGPVQVYLGDSASGQPLTDPGILEKQARDLIEEASRQRKTVVLIKAEKSVRLRDVARIGRIAASVPGMELKVSVVEME